VTTLFSGPLFIPLGFFVKVFFQRSSYGLNRGLFIQDTCPCAD